MNTYSFLCAGASWECLVNVDLTEEEAETLKTYAKEHELEEHLSYFPPTTKIYNKVCAALEEQCDDLDEEFLIWLPVHIRDD